MIFGWLRRKIQMRCGDRRNIQRRAIVADSKLDPDIYQEAHNDAMQNVRAKRDQLKGMIDAEKEAGKEAKVIGVI